MLRAIRLTIANEARLLIKDPIVLFMLLFAPVVIIAVAGYSLGALYGGADATFRLPVVNEDRGAVADGIIDALRHQRSISIELFDDSDQARRAVNYRDRTPIAIDIPPGTTAAVEAGRDPKLILFIDPVRRIEADAIELHIDELCRGVGERARAAAQKRIDDAFAELRTNLHRLAEEIAGEQEHLRTQTRSTQAAIEGSIRAQIEAAMKRTEDAAATTIRTRQDEAWRDVQHQLAAREAILRRIQDYLARLQESQRAFEAWLAKLRTLAGSHASDIPPPPSFPTPPSEEDLALLARPITPPKLDATLPTPSGDAFAIKIPKPPAMSDTNLTTELDHLEAAHAPTLPGNLTFIERSALEGEPTIVNAFDQYVPGFGITFLLIGMMLGIALTLFDEREWGTLRRLRVSGAPLSGLLLGKLIARFLVGIAQMVLLFAVGRALFGIELGRYPLALLIPTVGISFASAALGLLIASIARAHDSVMPFGVTLSMAIAAIGGCWWPLDFEPPWMRAIALFAPTTWTMQAFNDLMIRHQPPWVVLRPFAATIGLGLVFLVAGLVRFAMLED
ncbi:MAG TPA: ABC transporter permease [Candidatus Binataceae bacterium]|nr:ABC transporter permease [Candidatus Binataceae bacterium]